MRAPLPRRPRNRSPALGHPSARAPFAWGGLQPPSCAAAAFARSAVARRGRPMHSRERTQNLAQNGSGAEAEIHRVSRLVRDRLGTGEDDWCCRAFRLVGLRSLFFSL